MVNKLKKFFKSIGKSQQQEQQLRNPPSSYNNGYVFKDNQYMTANQESYAPYNIDPATPSGSEKANNDALPHQEPTMKWGQILSKIPKLVAEATSAIPTNSSLPSSSGFLSPHRQQRFSEERDEMRSLLDLLSQMATKDYQAQILQYYTGDLSRASVISSSSASPAATISNWEHRKLFRQCRRSLLLAWKFMVAQLNDAKASLQPDTKEVYYQLIGLIAERVEFNLAPDPISSSSTNGNNSSASTNRGNQKPPRSITYTGNIQGIGWTTTSSASTFNGWESNAAPSVDTSSATTSTTNTTANATDEGVDGERDLYLYRCLLIATFKYVTEIFDAALNRKRAWLSLAETQFFAKTLAICFFRVPILQRMMLDQLFQAYQTKKWVNVSLEMARASDSQSSRSSSSSYSDLATDNNTSNNTRLQRRRSSARLMNGVTFAGLLNRWNMFEGHLLSEDDTNESTTPSFVPPSYASIDRFKRLNPTLFRWTRYSPYLGPYADVDVFRLHEAGRASWLEKLSQDGEFFAIFMGFLTLHADITSGSVMGANGCANEGVLWWCLPGYPLLIRIALLLLKEACWEKWLYVSESPASLPLSVMDPTEPTTSAFELRAIRGVRTVFENVGKWATNSEILESCVLAMYECTNVLNPRSVEVCLTRIEEWLSATVIFSPASAAEKYNYHIQTPNHHHPLMVYRLPPCFHGQAFAVGIRIMLSSENFTIVNRVLNFLYNRMDYFDGELRQNILKAVVQRHMFLFLHWNADVRSTYHHLLIYKIVRIDRYTLDSPIDHLLVGRLAVNPLDNNDKDDRVDFDDIDGNSFEDAQLNMTNHMLSPAEFTALRLEQALWRAFDACIGAICAHERKHARDGNRKYQNELLAARSRAAAFEKLNRRTADDLDVSTSSSSSSMNEGLPGGKPWLEMEVLEEELRREPPYYLRYLPADEVSMLDELRRLAMNVKYPPELQVYAAASLRSYSDLLKKYYFELSEYGVAEAPALGFC